MIFYKNKEISQIVLNGKQIDGFNSAQVSQDISTYEYRYFPRLKNKKALRKVPADFLYNRYVEPDTDYDSSDIIEKSLSDNNGHEVNYYYHSKGNVEGTILRKEEGSVTIYGSQKRNIVKFFKNDKDYYDNFNEPIYDTTFYVSGQNVDIYPVFKTRDKQTFRDGSTIYVNNLPKTSSDFKKTNYCTLQLAFSELAEAEGNYTIELANTDMPYIGPFYYAGKANITIIGNGQTLTAENNGTINNEETERSVFEWAGSGKLTLTNLTIENTTTRDYYGEENTAGEVLGISGSGDCIAVKCSFKGYQDTLRLKNNCWFYNCTVDGDVDFIWAEVGLKTALIEKSIINCIHEPTKDLSSAAILCPRMEKSPFIGKGIVLKDCTINISTGTQTDLGRNPWAEYNSFYNNAALINCNIISSNGASSNYVAGTYLRNRIWGSAATSPTTFDKVGFKEYNVLINGSPIDSRKIEKTTEVVTEVKETTTNVDTNVKRCTAAFKTLIDGVNYDTSWDGGYKQLSNFKVENIITLSNRNSDFYYKVDMRITSASLSSQSNPPKYTELSSYYGYRNKLNFSNVVHEDTICSGYMDTSRDKVDLLIPIYIQYPRLIQGLIVSNYKRNDYYWFKFLFGSNSWEVRDSNLYDYLFDADCGDLVGTKQLNEILSYLNTFNWVYRPKVTFTYYGGFTEDSLQKITERTYYLFDFDNTSFSKTLYENETATSTSTDTSYEPTETTVSYEQYYDNFTPSESSSNTSTSTTSLSSGGSIQTTITTTKNITRKVIDARTSETGTISDELYSQEYNKRYDILTRHWNNIIGQFESMPCPIDLTESEKVISSIEANYEHEDDTVHPNVDSTFNVWDFGKIKSYYIFENSIGTMDATWGTGAIEIDATNGKFAKNNSLAQFNSGATVRIPVTDGSIVIVNSYPGYGQYINIDGKSGDTIQTDTITNKEYVELVSQGQGYISSIYVMTPKV